MADDWEINNLEQQVIDLDHENEELRDLLKDARNMIAELSHHIEDRPALDRRVADLLDRLPR